jgi:hypothetical protein
LLASTPASAAMPRSVVVQDSVGTVKLAVSTVADPAGTVAWYPANVRVLVVAAIAGAATPAAKPAAAAAAAAQVMMVRVLLNMVVLLWW